MNGIMVIITENGLGELLQISSLYCYGWKFRYTGFSILGKDREQRVQGQENGTLWI